MSRPLETAYSAAYRARQKDKSRLHANLVLSPADTELLGRLMTRWGVSRQEALRRAVRIAAETEQQAEKGDAHRER